MEKAIIRVPASTSNLGPGFDVIGMALSIYLEVRVERTGSGAVLEFPDAAPAWTGGLTDLCLEAIGALEKRAGRKAAGFRAVFKGDVPLARGLGSSAAYRAAAMASANALWDRPLSRDELFDLTSGLERHTDNAAPCVLGGLTVSGWYMGKARALRFKTPSRYRLVALVPERELSTAEARRALPEAVKREDAVFNMQRAIWLVHGLTRDEPEVLKGAFEDRIHQPYRKSLAPYLEDVIKAAVEAGALGGFLSGAGSSVIALCEASLSAGVARAMEDAFQWEGSGLEMKILEPDNQGLAAAALF